MSLTALCQRMKHYTSLVWYIFNAFRQKTRHKKQRSRFLFTVFVKKTYLSMIFQDKSLIHIMCILSEKYDLVLT